MRRQQGLWTRKQAAALKLTFTTAFSEPQPVFAPALLESVIGVLSHTLGGVFLRVRSRALRGVLVALV